MKERSLLSALVRRHVLFLCCLRPVVSSEHHILGFSCSHRPSYHLISTSILQRKQGSQSVTIFSTKSSCLQNCKGSSVLSFLVLLLNAAYFSQAFVISSNPKSLYTPIALKMRAEKIDGKAIAAYIREELKEEVAAMAESGQQMPGLAVILVGSRRDSQTYVNMKKKACTQVGIASFGYDYDETVTQQELLERIQELNDRNDVHGILVQLPLPAHIEEQVVLDSVLPQKDVDGLHPENVAKLALQGAQGKKQGYWEKLSEIPFSVPCTPLGCMELLDRSGVDIKGKKAVVIGRSNLVGLPISFLLLHRNATVMIVHSQTQDIEKEVSTADIVIAAVGRAKMVKGSWLKEGAVVIDVGINSVDLPPEQVVEGKKPYKLVGDVDYEDAKEKCSKLTPVPGGVGPMTIAMLLRNTVNSCKRASKNMVRMQ